MSSKPQPIKERQPRKEIINPESKNDVGNGRKDVKSSPFKSRFERDRTPPRFRGTREIPTRGSRYQDVYGRRSDEEVGMKRERSSHSISSQDGSSGSRVTNVMAREFVPSSEVRRQQPDAKPFTDDTRLSKLVRRLCRDDDRDRRLTAGKQLREIMPLPENVKVIVRNSDALLLMLHDVLYERTYKELKQEAATCIGMVGCVMGNEAQRYFQWVFNKIQAAHSDEGRILLLSALFRTMETDEEKNKFPEYIPIVMTNCQGVLEGADTPDVLMAVVDVIVYIATEYPHVFGSHFRNTVDILVGWHIDSTQKDSLIQFTSDALVSFHEFWVSDMGFCVTLLGQFLEDMEAYAEDLGLGLNDHQRYDEDMPTPEECITKIGALLRVFTTVADSLKDYFNPEKGAGISWEYLFDVVERIIKCIDNTIKNLYNEKVLLIANKCLVLLCGNLGSETEKISEPLLTFLINQAHGDKIYSNAYLSSLFKLIQKTIELVKTKLPVDFIAQLFASDSLLLRTRFASNRELLGQLMKLYHCIFGMKSVPLMEEVYRHILGDIENCFNLLLSHYQADSNISLVAQNPYPFSHRTVRQAESIVIFNVCALAEVGNNKSNLIGMWALSPSIFDLFARHLLALDPSFLEQIPAITYAVFQALYSHCSRHGHFITSSNLITQHTVLEGTLLANVSPTTGEHFSTVLSLLADLHTGTHTTYDVRCLALKWSHDIVEALSNTQNIYRTSDFINMVEAVIVLGYTTESDISLKSCLTLQSFLKNSNHLPERLLLKCKDLCGIKMAETVLSLRDGYTELLKLIPLDVTVRKIEGVVHKTVRKKKASADAFWLARRYHMTKSPMGTFHSHNFRSVMGFILENIQPNCVPGVDWLERIYHSSQRLDKEPQDTTHSLHALVNNNNSLLWFWATWEAAQFCILAKLRTPLGKPQDTFMSIEAALKQYAAQVKNQKQGAVTNGKNNDNGKSAIQENGEENLTNGGTVTTKEVKNIDAAVAKKIDNQSLFRVHLLLEFMENLEKLLYNAYEGSALAMVAPPKAVRTFFRTNRSTCLEWLTRVRLSLIIVSKYSSQPAAVIKQAFELLREMKDSPNFQANEFERVLMYVVQALAEMRCPEVIHGLYVWSRDIVGKKLNWMKGFIDMASGKYEIAVTEYRTAVRQLLHPETPSASVLSDNEAVKQKDSPLHSPASASPFGSPSQQSMMDSIQKVAILSKDKKDSTSNNNDSDSFVTTNIINQVSETYTRLGSFEEVLKWQDTLDQYQSELENEENKNNLQLGVDLNYIKALSRFEEGDFLGVRDELSRIDGGGLDDLETDDHPQPRLAWCPSDLVEVTHKEYLRGVTLGEVTGDVNNEIANIDKCLKESHKLCTDILYAESLQWPPIFQNEALTNLYGISFCQNQLKEVGKPKRWLIPVCNDLKFDAMEHEVGTCMQAISYLRTQQGLQDLISPEKLADFDDHISKLQLATSRLARKQQNFHLAEQLLIDEIQSSLPVQPESETDPLDNIGEALKKIRAANGTNAGLVKLLTLEREGAKLVHDKGQPRDAIESLVVSVVTYADIAVQYKGLQYRDIVQTCSELNARSLVTLVSWLQHEHKYLASLATQVKWIGQGDDASVSHIAQNLKLIAELESIGCQDKRGIFMDEPSEETADLADNPILTDSDAVIGRLLHYSTMQCPTLSKSWFSLAGWCYKWGRKSVDNAVHGSIELSMEEKSQILTILPRGTSIEETDSVLAILSQLNTKITSEEDISDQDQTLYDDGTETTRKQLLNSCISLQIASDNCLDRLIDVWQGVVKRVYHYYQLSAKAYFTYLKLNGQSHGEETNMDGNITATLRLLRLLVKHAWELRGVLEEGLANTPTTPWKGIIPQLFSRLSHPEAYVRQSVSELLCRVANDAPHLIVYPAVVGASANEKIEKEADRDGLLNEYLSQNEDAEDKGELEDKASQEDDDDAGEGADTMLQNCFSAIVDTLANSNPRMISEVQLVVSELRRVTLLWDELWLGTLNQHHQDVNRRLTQLENEVKKVMTNSSLNKDEKTAIIREKHNTVLKPTLYSMERLYEITSQPPETKHEQWFQDTYGKLIEDALKKLRQPSNPGIPQASWQLFKQLHHSLQQKAAKRNSLLLSMDEISGKLSELKDTVIAMPGISTADQEVITIAGVHNTVQILPTKTKPKKLVFMGSDGRKYPYLFKGLEDLHLDERIMQFLSIVNNMFSKTNRGERKLYHARHYSVTPLGARSGLIQWVDGATPLFSLYKRWQQREALVQQTKTQQPNTATQTNQPNISRPSEVFYNKLTPLLKEKNITNMDNRKEWPMSVMRKVLEELRNETPKDLLAKELWCCSTSSTEWWNVTQTYNRSTAVMSVIGYIIGLGDRHLDNLLVDISSGEVVHIDYNVCFEKGKGLRVPEKVPFRMTPNLVTALGVTGVEGQFRLSCEYVMKTMRKGRETLLTLLEAFVYDPLVDWTTGNEGGYAGAFYGGGHSTTTGQDSKKSKKEMERDITQSMFSIRVAEMKAAWLKNRDEMSLSLPHLLEVVQNHLKSCQNLVESEEHMEKLHTQKVYLNEAKDDPQHPLYTLPIRYQEYAIVKDTKLSVQSAIQEKLQECEHWHKAHTFALQAVRESHLQRMCTEVTKPMDMGMSCFMAVMDFLKGAGQHQLATQCEQVSLELNAVMVQKRGTLKSCLDVLHTYATIVGHFPNRFVDENRNTRWQKWLQEIVCDFSGTKLSSTVEEFDELYGLTNDMYPNSINILAIEAMLQANVQDMNTKLIKLVERRTHDINSTQKLMSQVADTSSDVHSFMRENGRQGTHCMTSVVVSALCSLSKRYLVMEGAAGAAADRLMDLTSRDGDWFLDELCSMSGNVNHLLGLLNDPVVCQLLHAEMCQNITAAIQSCHTVYLSLQELNMNFRNIILPETLKTLQCQEPSVISILQSLDDIITSSGYSLDDLLSQLDKQLLNAIMGFDLSSDDEIITAVKKMRLKYDELLQGQDTAPLTPGQMLLMGFNGLFSKLDADFNTMLDLISKATGPDVWRKVDVIKEARSIQMTAFNDSTMVPLSNLFFVKQIKAMQAFFQLAQEQCDLLQGTTDTTTAHDDDQLTKPIKYFIAEYVRKHLIGLPSQTLGHILCHFITALHVDVTAEIEIRDIGAESKVSLEDLCKKTIDTNLKNEVFEHMHLSQATNYIGCCDIAWRKCDLAQRLDSSISVLKGSLQRSQLQLVRYQWLHEDVFTKTGRTHIQMIAPSRATVMSELRKAVQNLMSFDAPMLTVQEKHTQLEGSVMSRLKWAGGANPALVAVNKEFEDMVETKDTLVQNETSMCTEVISICNSVLHFEALRTRTPEAVSADASFLGLLNRCEEATMIAETCTSTVNDLEDGLMDTMMATNPITIEWINACLNAIGEHCDSYDAKQEELQGDLESTKEAVAAEVTTMRSVLTSHHKHMSDIRSILKSLAKQEEQDFGVDVVPGGIRDYVNTYKNFSENFTNMLQLVIRDDVTAGIVSEVEGLVTTLKEEILVIYNDLINFAPPLQAKEKGSGDMSSSFATALKKSSELSFPLMSPLKRTAGGLLMRGSELTGGATPSSAANSQHLYSPGGGTLPRLQSTLAKKQDKVVRDPKTGKAVQERNSYAVGVWRKVKLKLDGRDPDANKRLTVPEQVDFIIREATDIDNLCVLYEGWTPWV